jgi:MSHA biogenesis protein MshQ
MVAWWKYDDIKGRTIRDLSGSDNNGTLVGNTKLQPGRMSNAIELDGTGDYMAARSFDLTTETVTFVAWIKGWKAANWAGIVFSRVSGDGCGIHFGDNNTLHYTWNDDDEVTWGWTGGPVIPQDKWAMVAVAIEPLKATAYVCTDANGLQHGVNAVPHIPQRVNALMVGWDDHSYYRDRRFRGKIDEVRIYSYALSRNEIKSLYIGQGPGPLAKPEWLIKEKDK